MSTEALYLKDAYRREVEARVVRVDGDQVELDRTIFYPTGGGQPHDTGTLRGAGATTWSVEEVTWGAPGTILHRVGGTPPPVGASVVGVVDWERRHAHMRYHTALHILSGVVFHRFASGITGGQIAVSGARMDFALPDFGRELAEQLIGQVNGVVAADRPIHVRFLSKEEAARDPTLVRVAAALAKDVPEVRLIDIEGFDVQADGGTHVRSTAEVGTVRLERLENKGAKNKRMYLTAAGLPDTAPPSR
jgi:misacylated tRNA(Ala) deacylase